MWSHVFIGHMYLSDIQHGVWTMDIKKWCVVMRLELCLQNMLAILGSTINPIRRAHVVTLMRKRIFNWSHHMFASQIKSWIFKIDNLDDWQLLANQMSGASTVKYTEKLLQYTTTIMFLVKCLKVWDKCCLNWLLLLLLQLFLFLFSWCPLLLY